jgi:hypothetical protein
LEDITSPGTSGTFIFNAKEITKGFPTQFAPDMSDREALAWAVNCQWNHLGIWQPDLNTTMDFEPFVLAPRIVEDFVMAQDKRARGEIKTKWAIGVGVGVGLGGLFLVAIAGYTGYITRGGEDKIMKKG